MKHNLLDFYSSPTLLGSRNRLGQFIVCLVLIVLQACQTPTDEPVTPGPTGKPTDQYNAEVAMQWAALELKLAQTTAGFTPPVVSRALGYSGLTLYESVVHGMPQYQSLAGKLNGLTSLPQPEAGHAYHWAISANAAKAFIVRNLWANTTDANKATIDSLETALVNSLKGDTDEATLARSVAFGRDIAEAVFTYSKTDGGHEGYKRNFPADYKVPTGAGFWRATSSAQLIPMQPTWGQNRTFVKLNVTTEPEPPLVYSTSTTSEFFKQAKEVYDAGKSLTAEQRAIALFWADDAGKTFTPPGHGISITTQILRKEKANLSKAAEAYAKVGMAITDAFICCWRCKFKYNLLRPVSYIGLAIDPSWKPLLTTPPFPEYTSGHSSGSGATGRVLTSLFGEGYSFTDHSHDARGLQARSFKSFNEAAEEAAISRLYGGIHYRRGNEQGLANGKRIAENVLALPWTK